MKPFKSIVIVKHPLDTVWITIRDRMCELVPMLDEVASIVVIDRHSDGDGTVRLVNEWRARLNVPPALASLVTPEMLGWTDRAEWRESAHECRWTIEPFFLPQAVRCSGTTLYEPAIGGRGTRITFAGMLDVDRAQLGAIPASLGMPVSVALEAIVTTVIPKNFRKTMDAVEKLLAAPRA